MRITGMKITSVMINEIIFLTKKKVLLEQIIDKTREKPVERPDIKGTGEIAEMQIKLASVKSDYERCEELHKLELEKAECDAKLELFKWLAEEE